MAEELQRSQGGAEIGSSQVLTGFPQAVECVVWGVTVLNMASALPLALKMLRTGDTDNYPYILFILAQFCTVISLHYSVLVNHLALMGLNFLSLLLGIFYVGSYIYMASKKKQPLVILIAEGFMLLLLYTCIHICCSNDTKPSILGKVSGSVSFFVNCAAVIDIVVTIRTKSANFDATMLTSGVVSSILWYMYGYSINDWLIYTPQIPTLTIGATKIFLLLVYSKQADHKDTRSRLAEEHKDSR